MKEDKNRSYIIQNILNSLHICNPISTRVFSYSADRIILTNDIEKLTIVSEHINQDR